MLLSRRWYQQNFLKHVSQKRSRFWDKDMRKIENLKHVA